MSDSLLTGVSAWNIGKGEHLNKEKSSTCSHYLIVSLCYSPLFLRVAAANCDGLWTSLPFEKGNKTFVDPLPLSLCITSFHQYLSFHNVDPGCLTKHCPIFGHVSNETDIGNIIGHIERYQQSRESNPLCFGKSVRCSNTSRNLYICINAFVYSIQ